MVKMTNGKLFSEAKKLIPGGVNSPVRSFKGVGGEPVFIKQGRGSRIYSEGHKEFIDYCLSWGALILGHAHPDIINSLENTMPNGTSFGMPTKLEIELARLIVEAMPSIKQVRLTNSGTEAVMSAIRLARAYTKKDKIIKFKGSYHGHADYLLVKAGSGTATLAMPASMGVPEDFAKHTILVTFNNIEELERITKRYQRDLAAIIVEPAMANCGLVLPQPGFLEAVRRICNKYNMLLIFDEVITGFRLSYSGAQGFFKVKPDLTCLGKIIGGGLPVGGFGGRKEIMKLLAPLGKVYQAGTLSGNPIAVTAGIATLRALKKLNPYGTLQKKTERLCNGIKLKAGNYGVRLKVNNIASIFNIFFKEKALFKKFFHNLLKEGIYFSPSQSEVDFLSIAHTEKDIDTTLGGIDKALKKLRG